ncbi:Ltp family lipoprotein [Mycoplasma sp. P36-A1]|uniref:Ltp family lipoprotein n=1 Tax=Mycoplasma sp. P36-A1 TaxID=3252900 RepID=UPI003C2F263B
MHEIKEISKKSKKNKNSKYEIIGAILIILLVIGLININTKVKAINFSTLTYNQSEAWCKKQSKIACEVNYQFNDDIAENMYISQTINDNETINENITIYYSAGAGVVIPDYSKYKKDKFPILDRVNVTVETSYSNGVKAGNLINQDVEAGSKVYSTDIVLVYSMGKEPSQEFKNALDSADTYANRMNMSKKRIYDQLVSKHGGNFPKDAAQYAIDNVDADWNANALASAETYYTKMNMSKTRVYNQLISQYGGRFTKKQAKFAIDNLED